MCLSCEEVIDLDLNTSDPVLVIDSEIMLNESADVTICYSTDYYGENEYDYENNATVVLTTSNNESEELSLTEYGNYVGSGIIGEEGVEYTLTIAIDGTEYSASSTLLTPSSIVSLGLEKYSTFGSETYYQIVTYFSNNPDEDNYLLVKYTYKVDGVEETDYVTLKGEYFSADEILDYSSYYVYEVGTELEIELYSIDEGTYEYYDDLIEIYGMSSSSIAYNPDSNFGDDVLGYFRAWSKDSSNITVVAD